MSNPLHWHSGSTMSNAATPVADATANWVDTHAPLWARPYLRLARSDRPIGGGLLLLPCWGSAALAAGIAKDLQSLPHGRGAVSDWRDRHARRRLHLE